MRRLVKDLVFRAYAGSRPLLARGARLRDRQITVLLYHRVNDELRDAVTVGIDQFDRQMQWVATHYPTCSVEDVIAGRLPDSRRPIVVVTFDDGYADNYTNAAPILKRHQIPAAFFVTTGIVGTDRAFEHDLQKLGRRIPAMTWDQIRTLRDQGFSIGSHTVSHVNLARATDADAIAELVRSRDAIKQTLGVADVSIAYPYGKKTDITPDRVALIREIGYTACFSGYGGYNSARTLDLFDIKRTNIDFRFTLPAFRARIEGWVSSS